MSSTALNNNLVSIVLCLNIVALSIMCVYTHICVKLEAGSKLTQFTKYKPNWSPWRSIKGGFVQSLVCMLIWISRQFCLCRMHAVDGVLDLMLVILCQSLQKDPCISTAVYFVWVQDVSGKENETPDDKHGQHEHSFLRHCSISSPNRQPS